MIADRFVKIALTVIAVALVTIALRPWLADREWLATARPTPAHAQTTAAKYEVTVPKAWGKFIAFSNNNLLLEAPDGSWRIIDVDGRAPEYPRIKVLIHWQ